MAQVVVAQRARTDLSDLISSRRLPPDTLDRVRKSLTQLETFPLAGRRLVGRWHGFRLVLGPWPWMLLIYQYDEATETVSVLAVHDAHDGRGYAIYLWPIDTGVAMPPVETLQAETQAWLARFTFND